MSAGSTLLVIGEVFVDLTLARYPAEIKMRLGGIVHAARGLWASGVPYSVGAFCPKYLVEEARTYLSAHGCANFFWLGEVEGAPNVIVIGDAREVSWQRYEDILRDRRRATFLGQNLDLSACTEVLLFPGCYDLSVVRSLFTNDVSFDIDIAYDVDDMIALESYKGKLRTVIVSTSSPFFSKVGAEGLDTLLRGAAKLGAGYLLLKENRGGSRLFNLNTGAVDCIPAQLGKTLNSVGVGDAYSAVLSGLSSRMGVQEAAWRGAQVATRYAQTTFPDDLRRDVQRDALLDLPTLKALSGTSLPWHERPKHSIYLAAPDFSYIAKPEIELAVEALEYHNFRLRRPVREVGELPKTATLAELQSAFARDIDLLKDCSAVLAIPLDRDPGTLVEVGWAQALSKPVVIFDPRRENNNTMVVAGSTAYSHDLDECLNELFQVLSQSCPATT